MPHTLLENGQLHFDSIVFATDFSPASENAGRYAATIAAHFAAELVVVHAFILDHSARAAEIMHAGQSVDRHERVERLNATAAPYGASGLRVRTQLLDGDPSEKIAAFADALPRSLLVLGTHGGTSLGRHLIGSVAERCLRRTAVPTLTVGPEVASPGAAPPFRHMLYATDCSAMAARVAPFACAIAGSFSSELKVISIVDDKQGPVPDLLADLNFRTQQEIDQHLSGACDHFSESRSLASPGSARDQILHFAESSQSDLIILGVHRRASIELFDRNSITIQLIVRASCPVLTLTRDSALGSPISPADTSPSPHP